MFNLRGLDLNLLTVFEALYELGTVSNAADRLALSQSATSHALSRLRMALNDKLFVVGHHALSPTPTAQAMYPVIKQALEALRTSLAEATGFDPARSQRRFHISIPHPLGPFYAIDLRKALASVAPGVVVTFGTVSWPINLEETLREGIADVAVDWLPVELNPFVNTKLFEERMVLIARRNHPRITAPVTIEDLRKEEFIGMHRRRGVGHLPQALRELHLQFHDQEVVRVSELLEIPTVVASTDLLGLMPSSIGPLMERRLDLQVLAIPLELATVPIYLVWHESRRTDAAHVWLREIVAAELARLATG